MPNVVCICEMVHLSPTRIIRGEKLDVDNTTWIAAENEVVPANITIRAGSVIEKADPQIRFGIKQGWYAEVGKLPHTNLEVVFPTAVPFMGKNNQASLADVLRSYRINSLEQVIDNAEGREPFSDGKKKGGMPIRIDDILLRHGQSKDQIEMYRATAKEILAKES